MNAHERALELGAARFDFALTTGERQTLDGHLVSCAACRWRLTGMTDDARRLEARPARRMPVAAAAAVRVRLEQPARRMSPAMALVGAMLILLAVLATLAVGAEIQRRLDEGRPAVLPVPSTVPMTPVPSPALTPAVSAPPTLTWATLTEPDIRPKRGFEHSFLDSARGTMIQIRHLEGEPTTIVASTRDGVTWSTDEVPSDSIPAGQAVNGGTDWMQLVKRDDGRLALVASTDGLAWEQRGVLPEAIRDPWESAVNGSAILVCGSGIGPREGRAECVHSADGGSTWTHLADLGAAIDRAGIRGAAPLGAGFLVIVESEVPDEAVAFTSDDGIDWTRQAKPVPNRATAVGVIGLTLVAYGATDAGGSMASTVDGVTWMPATLPAIEGGLLEGGLLELVRAGDTLVALVLSVPPEGAPSVSGVLLSKDGRTWVEGGLPAALAAWPSPTFLPVDGGIVALGSEPGTMLLGTVAASSP